MKYNFISTPPPPVDEKNVLVIARPQGSANLLQIIAIVDGKEIRLVDVEVRNGKLVLGRWSNSHLDVSDFIELETDPGGQGRIVVRI